MTNNFKCFNSTKFAIYKIGQNETNENKVAQISNEWWSLYWFFLLSLAKHNENLKRRHQQKHVQNMPAPII